MNKGLSKYNRVVEEIGQVGMCSGYYEGCIDDDNRGYCEYGLHSVSGRVPNYMGSEWEVMYVNWAEVFSEHRGNKVSYEFFDALKEVAEKKGCNIMMLRVEYIKDTKEMKPHLVKLYSDYGFKMLSNDNLMFIVLKGKFYPSSIRGGNAKYNE
jgi:hypothetical protein